MSDGDLRRRPATDARNPTVAPVPSKTNSLRASLVASKSNILREWLSSPSILANTTIATAGRAVNVILGVIATAAISRLLGPANYGSYVMLLSFGVIIQLVADFGLYLTLTKEISGTRSQSQLISHVVSLRLALLAALLLVGALTSLFVPPLQGLTIPFVVLFIGLAFQSISQLFMGVYQYRQIVWRATVGDLLGRLMQLLVICLAAFTLANITNMATAFLVGSLTALIIHYLLVPGLILRLSFNRDTWARLIKVSWPLGAMLVINAIYFRIDVLILSFFRPAAEVGLYGIAYRVIESALFFPAMFGGLLLPKLSQALSRASANQAGKYISESLKVMLVAIGLGFAVTSFASPAVINLISGADFIAAAPILTILGLAMTVMFFGNIFGFALVAMNQQGFLLKLYLTLAVFNIIANLLFIPRFGAYAAAWTTVATEIIATLFAARVVLKAHRFSIPGRYILQISVIVAAIGLLSLWLSSILHILQLVIYIAIYGLSIYLFGLLGRHHLTLVWSKHD